MTQLLTIASTWLHSLATVVLLGHYILLGLVYLPSFSQTLDEADLNRAVDGIQSRMMGWIHLALVIFVVTGIYLTLTSDKYQGIGNFSSLWALTMLIKHIVVLVFVGIGFYLDHGQRRKKLAAEQRLQPVLRAMAASGVVILLLTAIAQAA